MALKKSRHPERQCSEQSKDAPTPIQLKWMVLLRRDDGE
jgi:hypothetical protein